MIRSIGMKNLSDKSIKKINRMIEAVLAEPELYDQNTFGENVYKDDGDQVCGTVCCAAGWAVYLDNRALYEKLMKRELGNAYDVPWGDEALKALDLEDDGDYDINRLFGTAAYWPTVYWNMYQGATTAKGRAKAFAARWKSFIKKDGIEGDNEF